MITTAVTLPLLLIIFLGIYYLFVVLAVKQTLHHGVVDATNQIAENARYWNIDPTGTSGVSTFWDGYDPGTVLPADFYDQEAKRVIVNRLRDLYFYPHDWITQALEVDVVEPILAYAPGAAVTTTFNVGYTGKLCDASKIDPGDFRAQENVRFLVLAKFKLPAWGTVRLPWMNDPIAITLSDRLVGYVQCPRWTGKGGRNPATDDSRLLAREGPFMTYRTTATPYVATITPTPVPTETPAPPTETPAPTVTP
jgi:hypothetical protein